MNTQSELFIIITICYLLQPITTEHQVGDQCTENDQCDTSSMFCDFKTSKCRCKATWKESIRNNRTECRWIMCRNDNDCLVSDPKLYCLLNLCSCQAGYHANRVNGSCLREGLAKLGHRCGGKDYIPCGKNAGCYNITGPDRCACRPLHIKANEYDCELLKCESDQNCIQLDTNSRCEEQTCGCRKGYWTQEMKQNANVCTEIDSFFTKLIIGHINRTTFAIALFVILTAAILFAGGVGWWLNRRS